MAPLFVFEESLAQHGEPDRYRHAGVLRLRQISTQELSYAADLIQSRNFRSFEAFIVVGGIYLLLSIAVRHVLNWVVPVLAWKKVGHG